MFFLPFNFPLNTFAPGTVPPELGDLLELRELRLDWNQLTGKFFILRAVSIYVLSLDLDEPRRCVGRTPPV